MGHWSLSMELGGPFLIPTHMAAIGRNHHTLIEFPVVLMLPKEAEVDEIRLLRCMPKIVEANRSLGLSLLRALLNQANNTL